jgi:phenylpropionate dioxygenase-like ring-hydroxylating dioxygenase large terminal subunit
VKSVLPVEAYVCESWFEKEQQLLFKPLWQFVAPRMLLSIDNAFVRRQIAGIDVVVQNFDGELKAFENVCSHRLNPLQSAEHGVRPLVCSYHAWRYGSNGDVVNIPFHDECYRLRPDEIQAARLRQFEVFEFGQLVFVNVSESPIEFHTQFDTDSLNSLREASLLFDSEVLITRFQASFNWKLAYENLRDSLHPRFVHSSSLYRQVKFESRINAAEVAESNRYQIEGSNSIDEHLQRLRQFSGGGLNEPLVNFPRYAWHEYVERYGSFDWYLNWLVYPNLHIASGSAGYSFIIEHHQPVAAGLTDLTVYYVTGKKKRRYPTSKAVLLAHLEGAEKVLREDIDVMERVQKSLKLGGKTPVLGEFEHQSAVVERWYKDIMDGQYVL